jgi:carboxymethylenebutenolidase
MALRDYLVGEVAEDYVDGELTRREALRRLGLLGLSATAASTLLTACAAAEPAAEPTRRRRAPHPLPSTHPARPRASAGARRSGSPGPQVS